MTPPVGESPAFPASGAPTGGASGVLLRGIGFYRRAISPALPARCRFYPTCSAYAADAVARHGALRGTGLAVIRLLKCAPWHPGGVDPVPAPRAGRLTDAPVAGEPPGGSMLGPVAPMAPRRAPQEESSGV